MNTPRLLLEHYLTQVRLPTMLREFPKLGEQCAKEGAGFTLGRDSSSTQSTRTAWMTNLFPA